ncbi:uncharacterized protein BDW43DRAFT_276403 [Aspergillus alliaceus]|uniref:uncharacterized protein n=1 Tax=Petromyces alliaceus TaxID=209559 RepID=UPI0012A526D9|nr:uncharacterized protein BDW43DRAFT_276403 [Aspergillus alliaceus]KAB8233478.1 hypothetical protein BDW43DRAFT_276403 [Aspergillus alliaceus]
MQLFVCLTLPFAQIIEFFIISMLYFFSFLFLLFAPFSSSSFAPPFQPFHRLQRSSV